jgi:hypothetical protein
VVLWLKIGRARPTSQVGRLCNLVGRPSFLLAPPFFLSANIFVVVHSQEVAMLHLVNFILSFFLKTWSFSTEVYVANNHG